MAKFPIAPGIPALQRFAPAVSVLAAGSRLARIYYTASRQPLAWNAFRYAGPVNARWDHHVPVAGGEPTIQDRGIYYAASDAKTCLAEFFQDTRRIDRAYQAPWLVIFDTARPLRLLNLNSDFVTRMGASTAIHSGSRLRSRGWARDLYAAYEDLEGIEYAASMNAGARAFAINERAGDIFPAYPVFNRALADNALLDPLKHAAASLGYALR